MIRAKVQQMQGLRIALLAVVCAQADLLAEPSARDGEGRQDRIEEVLRRESDALVEIADAAVGGRAVPADFVLDWQNDFFKAQPGTFVPFTLSFTTPAQTSRRALLYIRVERRPAARNGTFAYETIFPVRIEASEGQRVSVTRGFAVPPGRYRIVLVLREAAEDSADRSDGRRKAGVHIQDLDVPDFWTGGLATSTLMLASRVERMSAPVPVDELDEDPYAVGSNRIHVTPDRVFSRTQELIVAFLIYNVSVGPDRHFDIQVDYHLYKKEDGARGERGGGLDHPAARAGERYVTRTNPQRFNPSMMGAQFDPSAGTPMLAGQGIPLSGVSPGEYRLGITVTDLLSRSTLVRDVAFTVTGS